MTAPRRYLSCTTALVDSFTQLRPSTRPTTICACMLPFSLCSTQALRLLPACPVHSELPKSSRDGCVCACATALHLAGPREEGVRDVLAGPLHGNRGGGSQHRQAVHAAAGLGLGLWHQPAAAAGPQRVARARTVLCMTELCIRPVSGRPGLCWAPPSLCEGGGEWLVAVRSSGLTVAAALVRLPQAHSDAIVPGE